VDPKNIFTRTIFIAEREKNHPRRIMIMNMKRNSVVWSLFLILTLTLLAGCAGCSGSNTTAALSADNLNLIFVVSPDLAYNTPGDIQPDTANLTSQGLNRSLQMATYLKQQVLGGNNVTAIYALSPMTHLQTTPTYSDIPDMTAIGFIQQFALLNQITLTVTPTSPYTYTSYTANNYTINTSYASGSVPPGVAIPTSLMGDDLTYCPTCTGLDFNNSINNNDTLVSGIINKNIPGFYVFSAPWETTSALLTNIKTTRGYNLNLPTTYLGSNFVYVISIIPSGSASLVTYNSKLTPPSTYPVLPAPVQSAACTHSLQPWFKAVRTGGVDDVIVPANSNTNQRVYIVRHAEAHPDPGFEFEDGNYVGAGQWRALALPNFLPNALRGQPSPNMVYSIDPAQWYPTSFPVTSSTHTVSYVRPSLTVLPYAIANNLPFYLAAKFSIVDAAIADEGVAQTTSNFFFTGGNLSNQTILLAWESGHIRPFLNALLTSYVGNNPPQLQVVDPPPDGWPDADYDTIWTVTLDAKGNLTVDNDLCEGIDSASLPATAPQF
jgi:hypothetical protein